MSPLSSPPCFTVSFSLRLSCEISLHRLSCSLIGFVHDCQDNGISTEGVSIPRDRSQHHFGEHNGDVVCNAVYEPASAFVSGQGRRPWTEVLMASGEIGTDPAILLYSWTPTQRPNNLPHSSSPSLGIISSKPSTAVTSSESSGDAPFPSPVPGPAPGPAGCFKSLACLSGFHKKGIVQLVFSSDGKMLFSVGLEYSVAVYNTEEGDPQFGKMIGSAQGPKGKVLHCCPSGPRGLDFITCGEKHMVLWSTGLALEDGKSVSAPKPIFRLKQDRVLLGNHKNSTMMCVAKGKVRF